MPQIKGNDEDGGYGLFRLLQLEQAAAARPWTLQKSKTKKTGLLDTPAKYRRKTKLEITNRMEIMAAGQQI